MKWGDGLAERRGGPARHGQVYMLFLKFMVFWCLFSRVAGRPNLFELDQRTEASTRLGGDTDVDAGTQRQLLQALLHDQSLGGVEARKVISYLSLLSFDQNGNLNRHSC